MVDFQFPYLLKILIIALFLFISVFRRLILDSVKESGDDFDQMIVAMNALIVKSFIRLFNLQWANWLFYYPLFLYIVSSIVDNQIIVSIFSRFKYPDYVRFNKLDVASLFHPILLINFFGFLVSYFSSSWFLVIFFPSSCFRLLG